MPIAINTVSWGESPEVPAMLEEIRELGYEGVEVFQHPSIFGQPSEFAEALQAAKLKLVGYSGGGFIERCEFVRKVAASLGINLSGTVAPYVFYNGPESELLREALANRMRIAVHPHMFSSIQTVAEFDQLHSQYPNLHLIPDTAHLTLAGDDPCKAIHDNASSIIAIHLNDWDSASGRSYHFYANGFCPLGKGTIAMNPVLEAVVRSQFDPWLVIEQHGCRDMSARDSAMQAMDWLRGALPRTYYLPRT